jgi:hypothetical protein
MIKIKKVITSGWVGAVLKSYTNMETGNIIYTYNNAISTREELNNEYIKARKEHREIQINETTKEKDKLIESLRNEIDEYVEYIEDGNQYNKACERNEKLKNLIKVLTEL